MTEKLLPKGIVELDELEILVIGDNETDTLSSVDEGVPQIPEIVQLAMRTPTSQYKGHTCKAVSDRDLLCCASHGISVLITGRGDGLQHRMLFDVGPYPGVWLDNAKRLAIDLSTIEYVFLSHWHIDHSGGLPEVIAAIHAARVSAGLSGPVVDLHPNRPDQRGLLLPTGVMLLLPPDPTFEAIAYAGAEIVKHDGPHSMCDGFFFASGAIDRVTEYETGLAGHYSLRGDVLESDPLIMDERVVAACVRTHGVSVFSACSHAGIVNACLEVKRQFPGYPVDIVLGGYHLVGKAMEQRIQPTVRDLKNRVGARFLAPGHCTGWRAKIKLADAFAPGGYAPSVVGSLYRR